MNHSDKLKNLKAILSEKETEALQRGFRSESLAVLPSFADVHVHLREPGFLYKEGIASGTLAAARGGYGAVCAMPNLNPVPDSMEHLKPQLAAIEKDAHTDVLPYGSITVGERGCALSDMEELAPYVCAFSDDGTGLNDPALMREAMLRAKALGKIIAAHCEDMELRAGGYIHDGAYARTHSHKGISSESEWRPIERDLALAAETGAAYHVCHISCKESVELIRRAKAAGIDVSCETAPHYLVLNDSCLKEDGRFKMNPPIRAEEDRQALVAGLLDGTIDMIATDHAPHSAEEKARGLAESAMGVVGLETAFPVLYTRLVKPGTISLEKLSKLLSAAPRGRFGLPEDEDSFCIWDLACEYAIEPDSFVSKGRATPFAGDRVFGRCVLNVLRGKVVWKDIETGNI